MNDPMNPNASPNRAGRPGIRRMNNLPLYIGGSLLTLAILIVFASGVKRTTHPIAVAEEPAVRTVESAADFAAKIAVEYDTGVVPSAEESSLREDKILLASVAPFESYPETEAIPETVAQQPLNPPVSTQLTPPIVSASANPMVLQREMQRLQQFEKAVSAGSAVQGFTTGNRGTALSGMSSGSPNTQLASLQHSLGGFDTGGRPQQAYQSKLESLRAMVTGASGSAAANNPSISTSRNWRLNAVVEAPATPFVLQTGHVIPGVLISGINSDLPGQIIAQVARNVQDSARGDYLLIPQGAKLIGNYSSDVIFGQSRVLVAWDRIVFPDGKTLDIGGMQGSDSAGYSGYKDQVDTQFWRVISSSFLLSGIVAGVNVSQDRNGNNRNGRQRASDVLSESLGQQLGQTITQMIMKNLNVSPTIAIRPGYRFNIMVSKDMVFTQPYQSFDY